MANTFKSAATGSTTTLTTLYTCPASTTSVVHAIYMSNIDGINDATIDIAISGSANFQTRRYILKTVDIPADSVYVPKSKASLLAPVVTEEPSIAY